VGERQPDERSGKIVPDKGQDMIEERLRLKRKKASRYGKGGVILTVCFFLAPWGLHMPLAPELKPIKARARCAATRRRSVRTGLIEDVRNNV